MALRGKESGLRNGATPEQFAAAIMRCRSTDPSGCASKSMCAREPSCFSHGTQSADDREASLARRVGKLERTVRELCEVLTKQKGGE